jgi:RES domain-containing protein
MHPLAKPYAGTAAVAIKGDRPWDTDRLITRDGNRWSRPGEPTVYLAGDVAVAMAEFARHTPADAGEISGTLWTVAVELEAVVDLRGGNAPPELEVPDDVDWALDREVCRRIAGELRERGVQALLVPSVAFLDRPDRGNLVLFADRLGGALDRVIRDPRQRGSIGS